MARFDRKRVMRGAASSFAGVGVRVLLQLAQVPILYLGWDVKMASAWLVLWTLPSYLSLTVSSFSTAGGNFALEAKRRGDTGEVRAAYRATRRAIILSNLVMVGIVGLAFNHLIDDSQWGVPHSMVVQTIAWLGFYVVIRVQSSTQDLVYRYGEDYGGYGLSDSMATVMELAAMAAVVSLTHNMAVLPAVLAAVRLGFFAAGLLRLSQHAGAGTLARGVRPRRPRYGAGDDAAALGAFSRFHRHAAAVFDQHPGLFAAGQQPLWADDLCHLSHHPHAGADG